MLPLYENPVLMPHVFDPKDCNDKGHGKRSYPKYLEAIKDGKVNLTFAGIYTMLCNN